MKTEDAFDFSKMRRPLTVMFIFWGIAIEPGQVNDTPFYWIPFTVEIIGK